MPCSILNLCMLSYMCFTDYFNTHMTGILFTLQGLNTIRGYVYKFKNYQTETLSSEISCKLVIPSGIIMMYISLSAVIHDIILAKEPLHSNLYLNFIRKFIYVSLLRYLWYIIINDMYVAYSTRGCRVITGHGIGDCIVQILMTTICFICGSLISHFINTNQADWQRLTSIGIFIEICCVFIMYINCSNLINVMQKNTNVSYCLRYRKTFELAMSQFYYVIPHVTYTEFVKLQSKSTSKINSTSKKI
jgi:hypothetical protein